MIWYVILGLALLAVFLFVPRRRRCVTCSRDERHTLVVLASSSEEAFSPSVLNPGWIELSDEAITLMTSSAVDGSVSYISRGIVGRVVVVSGGDRDCAHRFMVIDWDPRHGCKYDADGSSVISRCLLGCVCGRRVVQEQKVQL